MRKSPPTKAVTGNVAKSDSYREAWYRIKAALEQGFYIEAAAIVESMMCDRLLSYLHGAHDFPLRTKKQWQHGLSDLTKAVRRTPENPCIQEASLWDLIDEWRNKRNRVVHSLARSDPGTAPMEVDEFLLLAKRCAEDGKNLFRKLDAWHKRAMRKARSENLSDRRPQN